jgi:hypothetical protein
MKCRHDKNYEIIELMDAYHIRTAEDGVARDADMGYNEMGNIRHYVFNCLNCNKRTTFPHLYVEKPVFIKKAIDVLYPNQNK